MYYSLIDNLKEIELNQDKQILDKTPKIGILGAKSTIKIN